MIYKIMTGSSIIYKSDDKVTYPVHSPKLHRGVQDAWSLNFTVMPGHPLYSDLHRMRTFVTAYRDTTELFYGRILSIHKNLHGELEVVCEGALTFLLDSELEKGTYTETITQFLTRCINAHNAFVEEAKRFTVGQVINDKTDSTKFTISDYSKTKEILDNYLVNQFGGFLRVRPNPNGYHFIDYIKEYTTSNTQEISIGNNIISQDDTESGENMFTILRPLGKTKSNGYVNISTLSQSDVTLENVVKDGTMLRLTDKISESGSILLTQKFPDAATPAELLTQAERYITRCGMHNPVSRQVNYVDFHILNSSIQAVDLGDVFSNVVGYPGQSFTAAEQEIDMEDPANDTMTLKNQEELNQNNRFTSGGGISGRSAAGSNYMGHVHKYVSERYDDNLLLLTADNVEVAGIRIDAIAEELLIAGVGELILDIDTSTTPPTKTLRIKNGTGLVMERGSTTYGVYDEGSLTAGIIVEKVNSQTGQSTVRLHGDMIEFDGEVIFKNGAYGDGLYVELVAADGLFGNALDIDGGNFEISNDVVSCYLPIDCYETISAYDLFVYNGSSYSDVSDAIASVAEDPNPPSGKIGFTYTTLGGDTGTVNFNIAATQTYIDGVAAAELDGWDTAAALTVPPSQGTSTSFTFKAPRKTEPNPGQWVREQKTYTYNISKSSTAGSTGYVTVVNQDLNVLVGRISIGDWYDAGWGAAQGQVSPPSAGTNTSFTVGVPSTTVGQSTSIGISLTKDSTPSASGYAYATCLGNTVGRISIGDWYSAGVLAGEANFSLATVTLQGTADSVYIEASSGGTEYYAAGTPVTYYAGNGGLFTVQGSSVTVHPIGTVHYYIRHTASETPTGVWYTRTSTRPDARQGYVFNTEYQDGGAQTYYNAGTTSRYARGDSVTVTPVTGSAKMLLQTIRYKAGSQVSNTYYTKN